jgi:predicted alpha/beta superfamily hydrolase
MPRLGATGRGDAYATFVARTLKPQVDARFRTRPGRESTGVLGSSMGGLISLYMALRDPDVWGFAGALSPSLWFADGRAFAWVDQRPPARVAPRVWLDMGTQEGDTLGEAQRNVALAREMSRRLRRHGVETHFVMARGAHTEDAWSRRLPDVLEWWLSGVP